MGCVCVLSCVCVCVCVKEIKGRQNIGNAWPNPNIQFSTGHTIQSYWDSVGKTGAQTPRPSSVMRGGRWI
jgi:hypothetical protein